MHHPFTSVPRTLMVLLNLVYSVGAYLADWSVTHVLNPRWPPHARFHNGQTMSLGALLASTSLYLLSRVSGGGAKEKDRDSIFVAAMVGSLYSLAGLSAILYPGTAWVDPEFLDSMPPGPPPNMLLFAAQPVLLWACAFWEMARIGRVDVGAPGGKKKI